MLLFLFPPNISWEIGMLRKIAVKGISYGVAWLLLVGLFVAALSVSENKWGGIATLVAIAILSHPPIWRRITRFFRFSR